MEAFGGFRLHEEERGNERRQDKKDVGVVKVRSLLCITVIGKMVIAIECAGTLNSGGLDRFISMS